jgi:sterol desaturase/sphingolipid hydroxylase (fatty acid hydroxylase superfamily)
MWQPWVEGLAAFLIAFVIGTLVEYIVHRLMHHRLLLGKKHAEHHRDGWGQGWLGEFRDYALPTIPALPWGFLWSAPFGIGWAAGGALYAVLAAYAHQLQHEYPDLVFWMPRPVHHLHHKHHLWRNNFGILVDWWDRVFGTYQRIDWQRERPISTYGLGAYLRIHWIRPAIPVETKQLGGRVSATPHSADSPDGS